MLTSNAWYRHRWWSAASPVLAALSAVAVVTLCMFPLSRTTALDLVPIAYLIPVIVAATQWGLLHAIVAAIASVAAADFFFLAPIYSFRVEDRQEVTDLLLFFVVALVCSNLASRLRRETETLRLREGELRDLYDFSRRLAACFTLSELVSAIQSYLSQTLGHDAVFLPSTANGVFAPLDSHMNSSSTQEKINGLLATGLIPEHPIVDDTAQSAWLFRKFSSDTTVHGVIAVNISCVLHSDINANARRLDVILAEASLTLQRLDIGKAMEDAEVHLQAQLLKDAFHGMLSHELRSPLTAIHGSASVLLSLPNIRQDSRSHTLVHGICEEATKLDHFTLNLLHASRITSGGITPRLACVDPADIVNAAIQRRAVQLTGHDIETEFAAQLPFVNADSALVEEAFGQLLENAAKYSPPGSTISTGAAPEGDRVILWVKDQGVGITPEDQGKLGQRSFRSPRHQTTVAGSGLGVWIASTFVAANAGTVELISAGAGLGTTARISLPSLGTEPGQSGLSSHD